MPFVPFNAKTKLKKSLNKISRLPSLVNLANANSERRLDSLKRKLAEKIKNHPVGQELDEGPYAENSVAIISSADEVGNLFSFIGFDSSQNPVDDIIEFLNGFITKLSSAPVTKISGNNMMIKYSWSIRLPDKSDFDAEDSLQYPDGFQSGSWVVGIEDGIIGIGSYLFDTSRNFSDSRSGSAIQAKTRSGALVNLGKRQQVKVPFISKLLKDFAKELKKL